MKAKDPSKFKRYMPKSSTPIEAYVITDANYYAVLLTFTNNEGTTTHLMIDTAPEERTHLEAIKALAGKVKRKSYLNIITNDERLIKIRRKLAINEEIRALIKKHIVNYRIAQKRLDVFYTDKLHKAINRRLADERSKQKKGTTRGLKD